MRRLLSKIGYWLYVKAQPKKRKWISGCEPVFNVDGHTYFRYKDWDKLPLKRLEELQSLTMMLGHRIDKDEFEVLMEILDTSLNKAMESLKTDAKMDGIKNAIYCVEEMRSRKEKLMFHPNIMMDIASIVVLRDDEDPHEINELITNEKKELFERRGDEINFFIQAGMSDYLPSKAELLQGLTPQLTEVKKEYEAAREETKRRRKAYDTILGGI